MGSVFFVSLDDTRVGSLDSAQMRWLDAQLACFNGDMLPATRLICDKLLPLARDGLVSRGIDEQDATRSVSARSGARGAAGNPRGCRMGSVEVAVVRRPLRPGTPSAALARLDVTQAGTSHAKHDGRRTWTNPVLDG